ncbi:cytochrome P450 [Streptomyces sp. NBC_00083]|uniref:cytochrome P450 n=1 Tax=Streptomyces sp. NBC_00083 TaxID=2975647 RepID=UPI002257B315|nr:cytochrome P450 [Streptomyces sp. NBC_00083]MCX5387293.1 cytochrome P450 [Streptomyces sp. NBC_00083]
MTRDRRPPGGVPTAPGAVPLLGHTPRLLSGFLPWLVQCLDGDPVQRLKVGARPAYLICCPELVHTLLVSRDYDKGGPLIDRGRDLLGNGLGTATDANHLRQRRLVQPAFTAARMDGYATVMGKEAETLAESWHAGQEIDLLADLTTTTMRVLIRALLPTIDPQQANELASHIRVLIAGVFVRAAIPYPWVHQLPTAGNRRFNHARDAARAAADQVVAAARRSPSAGGALATLMATPDDAADPAFTDEELRDQVITLLVAGAETLAATVAWLLHLLARHPHVETRLRTELEDTLAGATATAADLPALPYTRNVLLEVLRLYPPAPMLTRVSTTEVTLGGYPFPAGTDFFFSAYQLHHGPSFPNPERFDPARWDAPPTSETRHAYIPVSAGRRKCLGDTFALAEGVILISAIASRWQLRPAPKSRVRPHARLALAPAGLRMITEPVRGHHEPAHPGRASRVLPQRRSVL